MTAHVRVGGVWRTFAPRMKIGGAWKNATGGWVKVAGTWRKFYAATVPPAVTLYASTIDTNAGNRSVTANAAIGDLIVVVMLVSGATSVTSITDDKGGTYTYITSALKQTNADAIAVYIRSALCTVAGNHVITATLPTNTGGGIVALKVVGMTKAGSAAYRQQMTQDNQSIAGVPSPVFLSVPVITNPIIGVMANRSDPATMTPASGYTELVDSGFTTPLQGLHVMSRNSGETNTTIAWGSSSASAYCSIIVELDASP